MRRTVIGVMGGTEADERTAALAFAVGRAIAEQGWVLLSGGRPSGVMQASVSGARAAGGLTVGVLFDDDRDNAADGLDLVIPTGIGAARNVVNVLASDVVVACRGTGGTLSEIALALRFGRPVVLVDFEPGDGFLHQCAAHGRWAHAADAPGMVARVKAFLAELGRA